MNTIQSNRSGGKTPSLCEEDLIKITISSVGGALDCRERENGVFSPCPPLVSPRFLFLREFFSRALLSELLEQATSRRRKKQCSSQYFRTKSIDTQMKCISFFLPFFPLYTPPPHPSLPSKFPLIPEIPHCFPQKSQRDGKEKKRKGNRGGSR